MEPLYKKLCKVMNTRPIVSDILPEYLLNGLKITLHLYAAAGRDSIGIWILGEESTENEWLLCQKGGIALKMDEFRVISVLLADGISCIMAHDFANTGFVTPYPLFAAAMADRRMRNMQRRAMQIGMTGFGKLWMLTSIQYG